MWISNNWEDYELLDATGGMRLERWGKYILQRPDPQVIWKTKPKHVRWKTPDAQYTRSADGGGKWSKHKLPAVWNVRRGDLNFLVKPMGFKHTGLFPEQAVNWDALFNLIQRHNSHDNRSKAKVLNLFAYTGGATMACAQAGAIVTHVDAAASMVQWAKENASLNGVEARWIVDDCVKFVQREIRRGNKYDAIVMDPPSYGRGPGGEIWKLEERLFDFLSLCTQILSDKCIFVFINSYTTGLAPSVLTYLLESVITPRFGGRVESSEIGLPVYESGLILPCGATGRWTQY